MSGESHTRTKKIAKPVWWKNTYFWIAGLLVVIAILGLAMGPAVIRDPGQKREDGILVMLYLAGAVIAFVNGWVSHRQTVQHYEEQIGSGSNG